MASLKTYYLLTKPGIIRGNLLTAAAGFLLASGDDIKLGLLLATLVGTSLVIASACVTNNYIDREIDAKMARTKGRAFVKGLVSARVAAIYSVSLGLAGFLVLAIYVNWLTVMIGLVGWVFYVVVYGVGKRRTVHGTIIGSISGATPITAGYTAASGRLDSGALILFLILVLWQMPHFYAIAMYRFDDYKAAGLPVLPVKQGTQSAKHQIMWYIVAFTAAAALLTLFGYTGYIYLAVVVLLGLSWLYLGLKGLGTDDKRADKRWARQMFFFSLLAIMVLSIMIAVGGRLP
jgi:protoheme IX farnesyltransferase